MQESVTTDVAARTSLAGAHVEDEPNRAAWSLTTRVLFRFTFAYFVLFGASYVEAFVPFAGWVTRPLSASWYRITPWVGKHVLGMTRTISVSELSGGDRATDYIALLCVVVL